MCYNDTCDLCGRTISKKADAFKDEVTGSIMHVTCAKYELGGVTGYFDSATAVCAGCGREYIVAANNFDENYCVSCQQLIEQECMPVNDWAWGEVFANA